MRVAGRIRAQRELGEPVPVERIRGIAQVPGVTSTISLIVRPEIQVVPSQHRIRDASLRIPPVPEPSVRAL